MPKENITIQDLDNRFDELSGMIAKGFDNTVNKHDFSDFRSNTNKRFDKLEFKIDEVKDALECLEESDVLNLQKRVQILEKAVRALAGQASSK